MHGLDYLRVPREIAIFNPGISGSKADKNTHAARAAQEWRTTS